MNKEELFRRMRIMAIGTLYCGTYNEAESRLLSDEWIKLMEADAADAIKRLKLIKDEVDRERAKEDQYLHDQWVQEQIAEGV